MFDIWLTPQEKKDFFIQLEVDGWEFHDKIKYMKRSGSEVSVLKIKKHPSDISTGRKTKYMLICSDRLTGKYKLELFDNRHDKKAKKDKGK